MKVSCFRGVKCVLDCSEASVDKIIPGFGAVFQKLDRLPWEVVGFTIKQQPASVRQFFNKHLIRFELRRPDRDYRSDLN